ncbi:MAG: bifunctional GNAT family N-acetyltransferase/carbon-nitrogen hydrolase family protein [Polyangiaceae bacterium]
MSPGTKVRVRPWRAEDIPAITECHRACYADYPVGELYDERLYQLQFEAFPEGQFLAEINGKVVGYATTLIVQLDGLAEDYTYNELTGASTFSTHDPVGDTLYGADIAVHPQYRGQGIAAKLYVPRRKLMKRYNLRRLLAFGRIPGYHDVAGKLTAEEYVAEVMSGKRKDSALTAHIKAGYKVLSVRLRYMSDPASVNYSTLIEMENPDYSAAKRRIAATPISRAFRKARVCAAQYLFRRIASWEEFETNIRFFVDVASDYHCHFLVLPELVTAHLFATFPKEVTPKQAMRRVAEMHGRYLELFTGLAKEYQLYIVAGSTPVAREGVLNNVAHFFTPAGNHYTQDKLHITPGERKYFDILPGEGLKLFATPFGRIGIQICYDIEFPEVTRLLTFAGAEAIFVPFSTDDRKAYNRVRYSAQARAVENMVYVAIAGNAGNLPSQNYLINYAQSAVLTPSDYGFPHNGVAAEADPNVETVAIADLDFANLAQVRELGSVRPLHDRRPDLYDLKPRTRVELIHVE